MMKIDPEIVRVMAANPKTPWGKFLRYEWSTDRWVDNFPISIWKSISLWIDGKGWHRTEDHHLLRPGEKGYNPKPYRVTVVL